MVYASDVGCAGCKYLGTPYSTMDCQAFVERVLSDLGLRINLPGSNAWYREMTWTGSPEECKARFGKIPKGAFLFILEQDGKEPAKYRGDGIGNASHIGIYTDMTGKEMVELAKAEGDYGAGGWNFGDGAINSSSSRAHVCTSKFAGKAINGGWNRVGLWKRISYDAVIDGILNGGEEKMDQAMVHTANGRELNMREQPSKKANIAEEIPNGTILEITDTMPGWAKTKYNGKTGWVKTEFLQAVGGGESGDTVTVSRAELEKIYDTIGDWLGLRG